MKTSRFMTLLMYAATLLFFTSCESDNDPAAKKPADVYVAGSFNTLTAPQYNWVPAYWKNGEMVQLSEDNGGADAIAVIGDDVYVIGTLDANEKQLVLWTNGEKTDLAGGEQHSYVYAMKVVGTDWYAIGAVSGSSGERAAYWKNGTLHTITTTRESRAYDIAVDGSDIYVVGHEYHENGYSMAKIWKNDAGTDLTDGSHYASATGVVIAKGDVYVSGQDQNTVKLWKNGAVSAIGAEGASGTSSGSLLILNGDVYVSGHEDTGAGYRAQMWKNGTAVELIIPAGVTETYGYNLVAAGKDIFMLGEGNVSGNYSSLVWKNSELTDSYNGTGSIRAYAMSVVVPK